MSSAQGPAEFIDREGHVGIGLGFGLLAGTEDGTAFGLLINGDYFLSHHLSVGPLLQLGFDDDFTLIGFSGQLKYTFDVPASPHLHPNIQGGLGFVYIDNGKHDTDLLVPLGGGLDVDVTSNLSLGTTLLINVTGLEDDIYLSWIFGFRLLL